eukprot:6934616-Heterocapsa_arctica.AAC.1
MREKVKRELKGRGIPVHKEASSIGMEKGLGMTITQYPHVLKVSRAKLKDMVLAPEAVVREDWVRPGLIATLMGLWTWAMLLARPSLSIPDTVFKWMSSAESLAKPRKLWQS